MMSNIFGWMQHGFEMVAKLKGLPPESTKQQIQETVRCITGDQQDAPIRLDALVETAIHRMGELLNEDVAEIPGPICQACGKSASTDFQIVLVHHDTPGSTVSYRANLCPECWNEEFDLMKHRATTLKFLLELP